MAAKKQDPADDPSDLIPFTFRIPRGLIEALDARVEVHNQANPWSTINRSDLIRDVLIKAMQEPPAAPARKAGK